MWISRSIVPNSMVPPSATFGCVSRYRTGTRYSTISCAIAGEPVLPERCKDAHMPALPWTVIQPVDSDGDYLAMLSRLPLRKYRSVPRFLRSTQQIRKQLAAAEGLLGYTLNAQLIR